MRHPAVSGFSALREFVRHEDSRSGVFADTSILFSATYPLDAFNGESEQAFDLFSEFTVPVFTNVNVRVEYMENHRRILIAENLCDLLGDLESILKGPLPLLERLKSHRKTYRQKIKEERSAKMDVGQIKIFRELLSEFDTPEGSGWELFCQGYLHSKLMPIWKFVTDDLNVNFISLRAADASPYIIHPLEWDTAVDLMGRYGIASMDAMIVNMFLASNISALLTADLEMANCVAKESKGLKRIFIPDSAMS